MQKYVTAAALIFLSHSAMAEELWFHCDSLHAYYPYVRTCPEPWHAVPPHDWSGQAQQPESVPQGGGAPIPLTLSPTIATDNNQGQPSESFRQGQQARQQWEAWFNNQEGDFRIGAEYWADHRSLPKPGSCNPADNPGPSSEWVMGCIAAQQRLAPIDARRKTEPDYRRGFNTFVSVQAAQQEENSAAEAIDDNQQPKRLLPTPVTTPSHPPVVPLMLSPTDNQTANKQEPKEAVAQNSNSTNNENIRFGLAVIALVVIAMIYFLPSIVVNIRTHPNKTAIFIINLFLGWTFLGWVVVLAWAFTAVPSEPVRG